MQALAVCRSKWLSGWALPLLMLVVFGAGCSGSGDSAGEQGSLASVDGRSGDGAVVLFGHPDELAILHVAEQTLVSTCMAEEGFQYQVVPFPEEAVFRGNAYGNNDLARSQAVGYGLTSIQNGDATAAERSSEVAPLGGLDPNAAYVQTLSGAERDAFAVALFGPVDGLQGSAKLPGGMEIGFPLEGCLARARDQLYGDGKTYMEASSIVDNLQSEVEARVVSDDEYVQALEAWRVCMVDRGYEVSRPSDAVDLALEGYARDPRRDSRANELRVASADAECNLDASLSEVASALEATAWREVLEGSVGTIDSYNNLKSSAIDRALAIVDP